MRDPRIIKVKPLKLRGIHIRMNLSHNQTRELWQRFMPEWKLTGLPMSEFYSAEVYPKGYFSSFDPNKDFEKWAAVPETGLSPIPETWDRLEVPPGLYAVFPYKGRSSEVYKIYQYIFETWMPKSGYQVDERPHMAVMGEKYKNDDPESEEELWIPVKAL